MYQSLSKQLNNCLLKVEQYFDQIIVEFVSSDSLYHLTSLINEVLRVLSRLFNILHPEMIYAVHLVLCFIIVCIKLCALAYRTIQFGIHVFFIRSSENVFH